MKFEPRLVEKPWGGGWLAQQYKSSTPAKIGEAWLLSTLKEGESTVDGQPLSKVLGAELPFVVKIIDAHENLSVQVHPSDEWAAKLENSRGKTECWLILEAKPGAGIYLGLKSGVTRELLSQSVLASHGINSLLQFFPVQRGDFIAVPAGTIHAIGGGVTLLEVQQASGITYRLWDWGRPGRELHIEKGLKVSSIQTGLDFKPLILPRILESMKSGVLYKHSDFECDFNQSHGEGWFIDLKTYEVSRSTQTQSAQYLFIR
jgi:mannose-6-phosphate isomerase